MNPPQTIGEIRPFRIDAPAHVLEDLEHRLRHARLTTFPIDAVALGVDISQLHRLVAHWRESFDWRRVEAALNRLEHVLVEVDGMDIHAVRARGVGPDPLPVIVGHGWPSSFVEILPALDRLARPAEHGADAADAFDVIIPSLPGYLYSGAPAELADATAARIATRFEGLMRALGYMRYGASGGDVGARVVAWMGAHVPEALVGVHMSCNAVTPDEGETDEERTWLARERLWQDEQGAYLHLQRTKPRTVMPALTDSPLGLAAWVLEKWSDWGETRGDAIGHFGADHLLTHIMLFWLTGSIGTSCLTYAAFDLPPGPRPPSGSVTVPAGFYLSEAEPHGIPPRRWAERQYRVARWSVIPRGGHFLPAEEPELFAEDMRSFFRPLRAAAPPIANGGEPTDRLA